MTIQDRIKPGGDEFLEEILIRCPKYSNNKKIKILIKVINRVNN